MHWLFYLFFLLAMDFSKYFQIVIGDSSNQCFTTFLLIIVSICAYITYFSVCSFFSNYTDIIIYQFWILQLPTITNLLLVYSAGLSPFLPFKTIFNALLFWSYSVFKTIPHLTTGSNLTCVTSVLIEMTK